MGGGGEPGDAIPTDCTVLISTEDQRGERGQKRELVSFRLICTWPFMKEQNAINCSLGGCASLRGSFHRASGCPIGMIYSSLDFILVFVVFKQMW